MSEIFTVQTFMNLTLTLRICAKVNECTIIVEFIARP